MRDCVDQTPASPCVTIGESREALYLTIPPGQARDFEAQIYFTGGGLKPKGRLDWAWSVAEIRAD